MTKRPPAEIIERIKFLATDQSDLYGVERSRLLDALPWVEAEKWMNVGHPWTPEKWTEHRVATPEKLHAALVDYLPHAWGKANQCNGISAQRSLSQFMGLLWLLGEEHDELRESIEPDREPQTVKIDGEDVVDMRPKTDYFGKLALVAVSEAFGFNWRDHDDGKWRTSLEGAPITAAEALQ